jgi:hypothetical protein
MDTDEGRATATPNAGDPGTNQQHADRPRESAGSAQSAQRSADHRHPTAPGGQLGSPGQTHRGQGRRPGGHSGERPTGEHRDDRRRRREGKDGTDRKSFAGFGDEVERAFCDAAVHLLPETFPVVHRQGLVTLKVTTVATRPGAILCCDGAHAGPHRWPNGDVVLDAGPSSSGSATPAGMREPAPSTAAPVDPPPSPIDHLDDDHQADDPEGDQQRS